MPVSKPTEVTTLADKICRLMAEYPAEATLAVNRLVKQCDTGRATEMFNAEFWRLRVELDRQTPGTKAHQRAADAHFAFDQGKSKWIAAQSPMQLLSDVVLREVSEPGDAVLDSAQRMWDVVILFGLLTVPDPGTVVPDPFRRWKGGPVSRVSIRDAAMKYEKGFGRLSKAASHSVVALTERSLAERVRDLLYTLDGWDAIYAAAAVLHRGTSEPEYRLSDEVMGVAINRILEHAPLSGQWPASACDKGCESDRDRVLPQLHDTLLELQDGIEPTPSHAQSLREAMLLVRKYIMPKSWRPPELPPLAGAITQDTKTQPDWRTAGWIVASARKFSASDGIPLTARDLRDARACGEIEAFKPSNAKKATWKYDLNTVLAADRFRPYKDALIRARDEHVRVRQRVRTAAAPKGPGNGQGDV